MRKAFGPALVLAVILGAGAIGWGVYAAGVERGRDQGERAAATASVEEGATSAETAGGDRVVVVDGRGYRDGPGFFLFPLLVIGVIALARRGRWGGPGPWGPPQREWAADEWHRRAHGEPVTTTPQAPADER